MKTIKFKKIDAFSDGTSPGNPAGCFYLDRGDELSEEEMQQAARELRGFVNEAAFLFPEGDGFFLKYYSSECEVDFCGHATIGIMHDVIKNDRTLLKKGVISVRVGNDHLDIYNSIAENDSIFIMAPAPKFFPLNLSIETIAEALGIEEKAVDKDLDIDIINAGLTTLIVPITSLRHCLDIFPDEIELKSFCLANDIDIIMVFTGETSQDNHFRTRVFAPKFGYLEDPATGSGNAAFGCYLLKHSIWDGTGITIEQSSSRDFPNRVNLGTVKKGSTTRVIFGGTAAVKIKGTYNI